MFFQNSHTPSSAHVLSPNRWCKLPDLRVKRRGPAAACLPGDIRVCVFGGWDGSCSHPVSVVFCQLRTDWRERSTAARRRGLLAASCPYENWTVRADGETLWRKNHGRRWMEWSISSQRRSDVFATGRLMPPRPVDRGRLDEGA
ncbi:unnamed protein product [Schistocephalus solidus]|uniref:Uncharacterized protein n=1 Tax=Schistocephalus solidus TaxID=70667 RepID=A0A183SX59_SCHSO|nr:unnamed protein product [Schistocephalus solidus]